MLNKKSEKGQAIILIVFSIIGVIGLTALTVDGGVSYSDRRNAQGAADSAAWAGGLANSRGENVAGIQTAALSVADENGYTDDGTRSEVTVDVIDDPSGLCPAGASPNRRITVTITSYVNTFFAPVIGIEEITNRVTAVTRACGTYHESIFNGAAVVSCGIGLNSSECAYDTGHSNAAKWIITGSGVHSDTCVYTKTSDSVTLDEGQCFDAATGVTGGATGDACPTSGSVQCTPEYIASVMPPNPCIGTKSDSTHYDAGGIIPANGQTEFTNGVYCISNFDALDQEDILLTNATLYVTDQSFDLKFAGHGSFSGIPSTTGEYAGLYIVVQPPENTANYCTSYQHGPQTFVYRGNATSFLYGTVLAPSACVDVRGNGSGTVNGQIIGNMITSNGTADVFINYVQTQNYRPPEDPTIALEK